MEKSEKRKNSRSQKLEIVSCAPLPNKILSVHQTPYMGVSRAWVPSSAWLVKEKWRPKRMELFSLVMFVLSERWFFAKIRISNHGDGLQTVN